MSFTILKCGIECIILIFKNLIKEHLVKDNLALDFLLEVFVTWKQEKGINNVISMLKKSGLDMK